MSVKVGSVEFGRDFVVIAGPCAVERDTIASIAMLVKDAGANMLRGGAFKPRTNPNSFQGLGYEGLSLLKEAKEACGLPVVTEVTDPSQLEKILDVADMLQIGSRNMYNYPLLKEVGKTGAPVLLKRAFSATIDEWLGAAEYIGHKNVVLCERGIRSFDVNTRNVLDLGAVAAAKQMTELPIIVDPSHATGRRELVEPMALAGAAMGSDGLMIEAHVEPQKSLSDSAQAIDIETLKRIIEKARKIRSAIE